MRHFVLSLTAALLAAPLPAAEPAPAKAPSPTEIIAAAPKSDWAAIAAADLLVMDLAPDGKGKPRRVVIQLMPAPFSQGWVSNVRKLAAAHWWDGLSVYRVQDNYVAQWGDADGEVAGKAKALPEGLAVVPESTYRVDLIDVQLAAVGEQRTPQSEQDMRETSLNLPPAPPATQAINPDIIGTQTKRAKDGWHERDPVAPWVEIYEGFALGSDGAKPNPMFWPIHCYGMVGVARNLSPDTGTGAELYAVIGHAPRQLDRNIALVGRVIEGMEHLSSLPRGPGSGVYTDPAERTPIMSVRLGTEVPELPSFEYLVSQRISFARYAEARANRRDPFFIVPAGGADICNIPVPVRQVPTK